MDSPIVFTTHKQEALLPSSPKYEPEDTTFTDPEYGLITVSIWRFGYYASIKNFASVDVLIPLSKYDHTREEVVARIRRYDMGRCRSYPGTSDSPGEEISFVLTESRLMHTHEFVKNSITIDGYTGNKIIREMERKSFPCDADYETLRYE